MKSIYLILQLICILSGAVASSAGVSTNTPVTSSNADEKAIILPEPIPDPLERMNRRLWVVNEAAMKGVVKPTSKAYRLVLPPPIRIGVSNVGKNLGYPTRVANNLLQERWMGARHESVRFLCNSVLGIGGFFDVASGLHIPSSEADFGQTFGKWGWDPNFYLMVPLLGPSNDRDFLGMAADTAVNPITYFSPYSYIPTGITYNNLTDSVDGYVRRIKSEADLYPLLRDATALQRRQRNVDWAMQGAPDIPSLETMQSVLFGVRDPRFPERGRTRTVVMSNTGREFPYTVWLQEKRAPIVYIIPGIGAHRLNNGALALAELFYGKGFSVVTISSAFSFEFIATGLSADLPGYGPVDAEDIHLALTEVDRQIEKQNPGRVGQRGLMGYSMGGFHTLLLASKAGKNPNLLRFDRYLAIDAPVRLLHGISELDAFYNSALEWPAAERTDKIEQLLFKTAQLVSASTPPQGPIPLSATESRFLIGLAFRLNLRDIIFFTQMRHNQGVLKQPLDKWRREPVYREIVNFSFADYLEKFVGPYYLKRGIDTRNGDTLAAATDLRRSEEYFKAQSSIRVIANRNDILLAPEDVSWLEGTFGKRATLFPRGGHLGNLGESVVQEQIVDAFADLKEQPVGREIISKGRGKSAPSAAPQPTLTGSLLAGRGACRD